MTMKYSDLLEELSIEVDTGVNYPEDNSEIVIKTPKYELPISAIRVNHQTKKIELIV
jgi:hypothetical protein